LDCDRSPAEGVSWIEPEFWCRLIAVWCSAILSISNVSRLSASWSQIRVKDPQEHSIQGSVLCCQYSILQATYCPSMESSSLRSWGHARSGTTMQAPRRLNEQERVVGALRMLGLPKGCTVNGFEKMGSESCISMPRIST